MGDGTKVRRALIAINQLFNISPPDKMHPLEQKPGALGKVMGRGKGGAVEGGQDVALLPHYH